MRTAKGNKIEWQDCWQDDNYYCGSGLFILGGYYDPDEFLGEVRKEGNDFIAFLGCGYTKLKIDEDLQELGTFKTLSEAKREAEARYSEICGNTDITGLTKSNQS